MILYFLVILSLIPTHYLKSEEVITNMQRKDGFGAQFQNIINTVVYAELNNKKFVYTPFTTMEHNYDGNADFLEKKEHLINFIDNFELNNGNATPQPECHEFFDKNVEKCANTVGLNKIRIIFKANKNINDYFEDQTFNIAVHIRRPNIHDSRIEGTDTPDTIFLNIINKLRALYQDKKPLFHIFSQGNIESFKAYNASDVKLHLNDSVEDSFASMVLADILVTSRSSYSYTAALLSQGTVYYVPFWHSPLPHWIKVDTN
ncbi:MAG: hypothetical protein P4L22_00450 [Candidatus Babeliales bacterium]|nr:hypothetical protein [Candidatus Babeliales bacterium]